MPSITVRNIPDEVFNLVKTLAQTEKRSVNNELVILLEKGVSNYIQDNKGLENNNISKETQLKLWEELCGKWKDDRPADEMVKEIYNSRASGREVKL